VRRGLDVVQADLNDGLNAFGDKQLDYIVLSRTLQTIMDVEGVIDDMLRVGKKCIVSFPNFGYYKLRDMLYHQGRAPEAPGVLRYKWYDTPNIRVLTIADFDDFCRHRNVHVHRSVALDTERWREVTTDPNRAADLAICVISR
jgi:homoserine O-acetyltransferase